MIHDSPLRPVLVSHVTRTENSVEELVFGISGVIVAPGWILSHGSLLSPNFFGTGSRGVRDFLEAGANQQLLEKNLLSIPQDITKSMRFRVQYQLRGDDEDSGIVRGSKQRSIVKKDCLLRVVWRCPLLRRTFNDLLFSWSFEKAAKYDKSLLSIFLLLRVEDTIEADVGGDDVTEARQVLSNLYTRHLEVPKGLQPRRGATVELESAPFGSAVFLGSVSRGVLSNVLGERNCLLLTDANAVPGCEGAPLFTVEELPEDTRRRICGLVIAPLSWCRGEWVDYTFAANLQACLQKILRAPDKGPCDALTSPTATGPDALLFPDLLDRSVVVVKCGSGWGTGVVVDVPTGTILTCSHVVREAPGSRVKVGLAAGDEDSGGGGETQAWARLVYRTRDGQPYDVAVLRLEQKCSDLRALPLADRAPVKGTPVITAGYPFFAGGRASCSRGVVSRLTGCMLQTTCCVQSGASGGPVLAWTSNPTAGPELLGLIVSNAVSASANGPDGEYAAQLYPRFNMAVPATVIREPLYRYIKTGDAKCLESLSSSDPTAQETWNFYLTPRSKM